MGCCKIASVILLTLLTSCTGTFDYHYDGFDYAKKENVLSEISRVKNIADREEKFDETIKLEAKMIEEGVFLPAYSYKNRLQKSRFYNPNNKMLVEDYKYIVPFEQFIKTSDREEADHSTFSSRNDIVDFFVSEGYTAKDSFQIKQGYYFDWYSNLINKLLPTNNRGLFKFVNNTSEYDLIDNVTKEKNVITISIKECYWKDYRLNNVRKVTSDDFIFSYNLIKKNIPDSHYSYSDLLYDYDVFNHMTAINKVDDVSFSFVFDNDEVDVDYHLNLYPINQDMVEKAEGREDESPDYQDMVFAGGEYTLGFKDNWYILETTNENYLPKIMFHKNDDREASSSTYEFDLDNDILDINDITMDADLQYDDFVFGRNRLRSVNGFHLLSGDSSTKVYNEAVKFASFRKAIEIFLYNNIDLIQYNQNGGFKAIKEANTLDRFEYYDFNYNGKSYKAELNKSLQFAVDIKTAKKLFAEFKNEFGADVSKYPVELNFTPYDDSVFNTLKYRVKEIFGNEVKLLRKEWSGSSWLPYKNPENMFYLPIQLSTIRRLANDPIDELSQIVEEMYSTY